MTIWRMAMRDGKGGADMFDACRERGVAAITYAPLDEFDLTLQPRGEPRDLWSQLAPPQKGSLAHLAYDMKAGDTIYVKRDKWIIAKGIVQGDAVRAYRFDASLSLRTADGVAWPHQVPVNWEPDFEPVQVLLGGAQQNTIEKLDEEDVDRLRQAGEEPLSAGLRAITREALIQAITEFDRLEREAFLEKYGFKESRGYEFLIGDQRYDSKAIVGAAHGYLPGRTPLKPSAFSGGRSTVKKLIDRLEVPGLSWSLPTLPSPGDVLTNAEISERFGVGNSGGMRRSLDRNLLVLISDPFKGIYKDRWDGNVLHYTGMGLTGDQALTSQNRTLAQSVEEGTALHLLEALEEGKYTYAGDVELADAPYQERQVDVDGREVLRWMFPLRLLRASGPPIPTEKQARAIEEFQGSLARKIPLDALLAKAKQASKSPPKQQVTATNYVRNPAVAEYVKRMADGQCDLCKAPAPFKSKSGEPYLECHHIVWLAANGDDTIENTVALCPNCHRRMHVLNSSADRGALLRRAQVRSSHA